MTPKAWCAVFASWQLDPDAVGSVVVLEFAGYMDWIKGTGALNQKLRFHFPQCRADDTLPDLLRLKGTEGDPLAGDIPSMFFDSNGGVVRGDNYLEFVAIVKLLLPGMLTLTGPAGLRVATGVLEELVQMGVNRNPFSALNTPAEAAQQYLEHHFYGTQMPEWYQMAYFPK